MPCGGYFQKAIILSQTEAGGCEQSDAATLHFASLTSTSPNEVNWIEYQGALTNDIVEGLMCLLEVKSSNWTDLLVIPTFIREDLSPNTKDTLG
jgi:hypothetical protein